MPDKLTIKPTFPTALEGLSPYELTRMKRSAAQTGKKQSEETKKKRSLKIKETCANRSEEERAAVGASISSALTGLKRSKTAKANNAASQKEVWKKKREEGFKYDTIQCPHCGTEGGVTSTKRWHFEHCKWADKELVAKYEEAFLSGPMVNLNGRQSWQETARFMGLDERSLDRYIRAIRPFLNL